MPKAPVKVMMNVGNPELAFSFANLPSEGIGLARMEFIINRQIGIHPKALLEFDKQDDELKAEITRRIAGYASPVDFYVDKIAEVWQLWLLRFIHAKPSFVCLTSNPTSTLTWWVAASTNRTKKTQCWASVVQRVM